MVEIRKYNRNRDQDLLIELMKREGDDWSCYLNAKTLPKYLIVLDTSITYVAYEEESLCGYVRGIDDYGIYIYLCDLLVDKKYRGRAIGKKLMEAVLDDFPDSIVYVMSDVDEYYQKLGFIKEGSVFRVMNSNK
ncbi:MAG: Acetyltransferase (GNAT) family protein [Firmicutes bacterium ADurb.Bin080]|jgi:ribosomal protein S18 acetylase RimI-like enzyme|nr:GNAT family N-acetyltransferase [Clostridiales bacterium]OQC11873.1 MAG: Acetyltransferase (GNAT) family protein [Firmicutes bacterium ADurb.Bin080]